MAERRIHRLQCSSASNWQEDFSDLQPCSRVSLTQTVSSFNTWGNHKVLLAACQRLQMRGFRQPGRNGYSHWPKEPSFHAAGRRRTLESNERVPTCRAQTFWD